MLFLVKQKEEFTQPLLSKLQLIPIIFAVEAAVIASAKHVFFVNLFLINLLYFTPSFYTSFLQGTT
jgi:hypothetical protein